MNRLTSEPIRLVHVAGHVSTGSDKFNTISTIAEVESTTHFSLIAEGQLTNPLTQTDSELINGLVSIRHMRLDHFDLASVSGHSRDAEQ